MLRTTRARFVRAVGRGLCGWQAFRHQRPTETLDRSLGQGGALAVTQHDIGIPGQITT